MMSSHHFLDKRSYSHYPKHDEDQPKHESNLFQRTTHLVGSIDRFNVCLSQYELGDIIEVIQQQRLLRQQWFEPQHTKDSSNCQLTGSLYKLLSRPIPRSKTGTLPKARDSHTRNVSYPKPGIANVR
jgi:hypothetical protein